MWPVIRGKSVVTFQSLFWFVVYSGMYEVLIRGIFYDLVHI